MDTLLMEVAKYSWIVAVMVAMFLLILWLLYKINNSNIDKVKTELMTSINNVKIDMIENANKIKIGVDKDVVVLKSDQDHLSKQLEEVKFNIHNVNKNMVTMQHDVRTMNRTMDKVSHTLTLLSIQMGSNLKDAIKDSIDNLGE
jgi:hypothetical protein